MMFLLKYTAQTAAQSKHFVCVGVNEVVNEDYFDQVTKKSYLMTSNLESESESAYKQLCRLWRTAQINSMWSF